MKKTLPDPNGTLPHFKSGIVFCCKTPKASPWDELEVKNSKVAKIVNCINCRGQFRLSYIQLNEKIGGLHVGRLAENE